MKPISVSDADFKHTVENNYYVDKTNLLSEILSNQEEAILFCRPRRFGKTLNMSMLYYFFSNKVNSQELFKNLNISKDKTAMSHLNKHPIIFLSLKDLGETRRSFYKNIKESLILLVKSFKKEIMTDEYLKYISNVELMELDDIATEKFEKVMKYLVIVLSEYYNEQVVILIDEYDNAVHKGVAGGYEKEVLSFLRNFLAPVTKDNNKVKLIAFTGILRITKESLFSGMNKLRVSDVLSKKYAQYFGLTDSEIRNVLEDFNQTDRYDEIKECYNGYTFGSTLIYNPWSSLLSIEEKKCQKYWRNTASDEMIESSFLHSSEKNKMQILNIYENGHIIREVDLQMTLDEHFSNDIVSLFLATGYLKATEKIDEDIFRVEIVNKEISRTYKKLVEKYANDNSGFDEFKISKLVEAFQMNKENLLYNRLKDISKEVKSFKGIMKQVTMRYYLRYYLCQMK